MKNSSSHDKQNKTQKQLQKEALERKEQRTIAIKKIAMVLMIVLLVIVPIYLALELTGTLDKITSPQKLKQLILNTGAWAYLTFGLLQFLQVTFIPLPAAITTIAGVLIFGPWPTFFISVIAVLLGSVFAFWLGRRYGRKLVVWIAGEEETKKLLRKMNKGRYFFFLMLLFPGFPDDILCMVAGVTSMSFKFFFVSNLITRPIIFFAISFFGSGSIIPFHGWGIYAWIALAIVMAISFYFSIKKQAEIEAFLTKISNKLSRKSKKKEN